MISLITLNSCNINTILNRNNPVFVLPVIVRLFKNRVTSLIYRWQPIRPRWDYVDFTHILEIIQLLQLYFKYFFLILSQVNSENYQFHIFCCVQTYKVESTWKLFRQFEPKKTRWKVSILYLIWLEVRRLVWNKVVIVEWLQKCV